MLENFDIVQPIQDGGIGLYGVIACVHSFTTKPTEGRRIHVVSAIPTDRYSPP